MASSAHILKIVENDPFLRLQMRAKEIFKRHQLFDFLTNVTSKFFPRENEAVKHDLVEFTVQCLKAFCYHGNKSTNLPFYSIFRTTTEVFSKLYFVEIC